MTYSRSHLVDPAGGVYHVCSRCVRRAYLCGSDKKLGYDFNHRRDWIEKRILELSEVFPIDVLGFAVMSNHYHIVLQVNPNLVSTWSNTEVAEKWLTLNPRARESDEGRALRFRAIINDPSRLTILRERFASLSWYMRYLNEPLARMANKEDDCKGRFWEGRFKSQRLLDEAAIVACMVYVDLNPVRAGLTEDARKAEHTSLTKRLEESTEDSTQLRVINKPASSMPITITLKAYIQLVIWTEQSKHKAKSSKTTDPPLASRNITQLMPKPGRWQRALGSTISLKNYASDLGQHWIQTQRA